MMKQFVGRAKTSTINFSQIIFGSYDMSQTNFSSVYNSRKCCQKALLVHFNFLNLNLN